MPTQLSADDLATHQAAMQQLQVAQNVWHWWSAYLTRRYQLGPKDRIVEDGSINRVQ